jgi:hypothetical protein
MLKHATLISYTVLNRLRLCVLCCACLSFAPALQAQWTNVPEGGYPDGLFKSAVEEAVAEAAEESLAERVLSLGGYPAGFIEVQVEQSIEERVLSLGGYPSGFIETRIQQQVTEQVTEQVVEQVAEQVVENTIEIVIEESVAENIELNVEEEAVSALEENFEESIAQNIEQEITDTVEATVEETVSETLEDNLSQDLELQLVDSIEAGVDSEIDRLIENIETEIELDENRIHMNQWLVMAEVQVFEELAKEGYLFDKVTDLPGIGMRLAEVAAPSSFDITEARQGVIDVVGSERAKVDLNHIYTAGANIPSASNGVMPRAAISVPSDMHDMEMRIGMIDSQVDTSHASLKNAQIETRSFAPAGAQLPNFHGTAIASIIAGNSPDYVGLAPSAEVFAAAVFQKDTERGEFASTVSLVMALDWLVSSGVDVVNISLAGPPNRLLEAALEQASKRDVLILAAAGNGGPVAKPSYPAAYDSVMAVTAVDVDGAVFRLANRGKYLDISAPGVNVMHADSKGDFVASSGTSFAVPFAAAAAARLKFLRPADDARQLISDTAEDLGEPGRDEVYGFGLLRLESKFLAVR